MKLSKRMYAASRNISFIDLQCITVNVFRNCFFLILYFLQYLDHPLVVFKSGRLKIKCFYSAEQGGSIQVHVPT